MDTVRQAPTLQGHSPVPQLLRISAAVGSALHPPLDIALTKINPLPGTALAHDWLMGGCKGPAHIPWDNYEGPSHLQSSCTIS